jgi:glutamine amidotransferase
MIGIIDYGMGNLRSVQKAFERCRADARIITTPAQISESDKIVLPGVGAFADAIAHLRERRLVDSILASIKQQKPFLGICLGLQMLFDVSYEDGEHRGLGVIPGRVVRFDWTDRPEAAALKIPHMGWNQVHWRRPCPLLDGLTSGEWFYFVHSYYVVPQDPSVICGRCDYGLEFAAMIWKDNIVATQFHPEKSQRAGLKIIENFAGL